ncbi:MAG TPA: hypothetical protein VG929_02700 [Actinomycetota bacterium]|nr:hypothetical protein [Actinomycetota bacterium]
MRANRIALIAVALAGVLMTTPLAAAQPNLPTPESVGFSSSNVQWVSINPAHAGTSGGKLVGKFYYLTDPRGLFIYDTSKPESPQLVGRLAAPQIGTGAALAQEDPDTNGKILLVNAYSSGGSPTALQVVDVSDKAAPKVIGSIALSDHTWTCFLDCKYAIGRTGYVLDLTDPTAPKEIGNWKDHVTQPSYMHDFEEVAPGLLIGAGQPSFYIDMRNPTKPKQLSAFSPEFHSLGYHSAIWPRKGKDSLLLMGAEVAPQGGNSAAGSDCAQDNVHALATYDASAAVKRGPRPGAIFRRLSEWRVAGRGAYADGKAPGHTLYCGHWFDPHPKWRNGGIVAIGHYDWGTRFVDVSRDGKMEEVGYFQPVAGHTSSAEWISDEIVYVHDYRRGLEILRFSSK